MELINKQIPQKDFIMKRFWMIYYGIAILANVVAAIVFHENIHISWHSLFPIGYSSLMILFAFFLQAKKHTRF